MIEELTVRLRFGRLADKQGQIIRPVNKERFDKDEIAFLHAWVNAKSILKAPSSPPALSE
ncbi:MAG TPA: hypothetical protein VMT20_06935 [Terriglobia bacterium]|nr:hypothetical protein [Terriglobia bacterium]